jgi:hypothetical protein
VTTSDLVYIPFVVKMARTKLALCRGRQLAKLRRLIAAAESADLDAMAFPVREQMSDNSVFCAALDRQQAAGTALWLFADAI